MLLWLYAGEVCTMSRTGRLAALGTVLLFLILSAGCGGGGEGGTTSGGTPPSPSVPKALRWTPPTAYSDGSALNPTTDIDSFEIYVKDTPTFTNGDAPMAQVAALDPVSGQVVTSFNLANLYSQLSPGVTYHVSVRAKAKNGAESVFSPSASFTL